MGGNMKGRWSVPVTVVANEFIDTHMTAANDEYVKVYLYVPRHQGEDITMELIADALNHTESNIHRVLSYWKKTGALTASEQGQPIQGKPVRPESGDHTSTRGQDGGQAMVSDLRVEPFQRETGTTGRAEVQGMIGMREPTAAQESAAIRERTETTDQEDGYIPVYSTGQVNRLAQSEEFSQLLYIAQKYMNKVFTPRDCRVFAYLYEGLSMSSELLGYLIEYYMQDDHISVRRMETAAISWHEKGIKTALEVKDHSASYNRDFSTVTKAFGISNRKPAAPEQKLMDKWFGGHGFSREVVLEACSRTITTTHNPSFQYADKILSGWRKAGVRGLADIENLNAKHTAAREESSRSRGERLQKYDSDVSLARQGSGARKNSSNQSHNLKQGDTDYDALVLKQIKEWVGQQP